MTANYKCISAIASVAMGGIASAAYLDLIIRSSPRGLQGTTLMMAASLLAIAARFGDVLGTNLYDYSGGFVACVIATTTVYALILPTLLLVPRYLTANGRRRGAAAHPIGKPLVCVDRSPRKFERRGRPTGCIDLGPFNPAENK